MIADPFTAPFSDANLKAMPAAGLLFFRQEVEDVIKAEFHASRVIRLLKQRDDFPDPRDILVPKAGHFSFIAPFAESVGRSLAGPEGFDRAVFHEEMNRRAAIHDVMNSTIVTFFEQALSDCVQN